MAVPCDMLLHPELLSNEQLISVIQERYLRIPNIQNLPRDELLELFHNFCVPYGQRKYKDKGRGKILNRARQTSPEAPTSALRNYASGNLSRKPHVDTHDRVKPPPDILSGHLKRIKIATLALPMNDNNMKRKMSISSDTPATPSPPPKKEKKPITWP